MNHILGPRQRRDSGYLQKLEVVVRTKHLLVKRKGKSRDSTAEISPEEKNYPKDLKLAGIQWSLQ